MTDVRNGWVAASVATGDVEISYRRVGDGPQLVVLVHGWPQTGMCWRKVVGPLSGPGRTVVVPDLRGYGASGLARTGRYDKRSAAADLHALLGHLGHASAVVVGHDRGARVAHRWALDRPEDVDALVLLDVLPTRVVMRSFDRDSASEMWHWFFHRRPDLAAELIGGNVETYLRSFLGGVVASGAVEPEVFRHYVEALKDPGHLRATLEDYRSGFEEDLELDERDHATGVRVSAPLLLLWGAAGGLARDDVVGIWRDHHADPGLVSGHVVPGGHYLPEEAPDQVVAAVAAFLDR